jgi:hypothetical protein
MRLKLKKYQCLEVPAPNLQRGKHAEKQVGDRPTEAEICENRKDNYHIFHQLRTSD